MRSKEKPKKKIRKRLKRRIEGETVFDEDVPSPITPPERPLNARQERAVEFLFHKDNEDMDLYWAYKKAGYKGNRVAARIMFNQPNMRRFVIQMKDQLFAEASLSKNDILKGLQRIIEFDPRKLYDAEGNLKKVTDLDEDTALALSFHKVKILKDGTFKADGLKGFDKNTALRTAGIFRGMQTATEYEENLPDVDIIIE